MSTGADQLRAALARKQGVVLRPPRPAWDGEIRFVTEGRHIASDGKPYTITYDPRPQ